MDQRSSKSHDKRSGIARRRPSTEIAFPPRNQPSSATESPEIVRQRVEQQVQLGIDSLRGGRLQDAEEFLKLAVTADPQHAVGHNCLGILYRSLGRTDDAILHYRRALRINPN